MWRRVWSAIWGDEAFEQLSSTDKLLVFYLITSDQTNRIGLYKLKLGAAAEDCGLALDECRESFKRVCEAFGWEFDEATRMFWIPSWFRYQPPSNADHMLGNLKDFDHVSETPLKRKFVEYSCDLGCTAIAFASRSRNWLDASLAIKAFASANPELEIGIPHDSLGNTHWNMVVDTPGDTLSPHPVGTPRGTQTRKKKQELRSTKSKNTSSELGDTAHSKLVMSAWSFPVSGGKSTSWELPLDKIAEWSDSYPAVNVELELGQAKQWLADNPKKRKTPAGMTRFLGSWMSRVQNNGGSSDPSSGSGVPRVPGPKTGPDSKRMARRAELDRQMEQGRD